MSKKPPLLERVTAYLARQPFKVRAMAELAPGVIGVHDDYTSKGEWTLYFDTTRWEANRACWGDSLAKPGLVEQGVHVAELITMPFQNFAELLSVARQVLQPKHDATWHQEPSHIAVPEGIRAPTVT